jgi:hypothetical protein
MIFHMSTGLYLIFESLLQHGIYPTQAEVNRLLTINTNPDIIRDILIILSEYNIYPE